MIKDISLSGRLNKLVSESMSELREIGLGDKIPNNLVFTINYRAKKRFGQCCHKKNINISSWLLELGTDKDIKDTIIHEILHTFKDTNGHDSKWKYYARYVNNRTDYNISRCGSINQIYKNANVIPPKKNINYKWRITCRGCGAIWYKTKTTGRVLNSYINKERYHKNCGCSDLKVENLESGEVIC